MLRIKRILYCTLIFLIVGFSNIFGQEKIYNQKIKIIKPNLYKIEYSSSPYVFTEGWITKRKNNLVKTGIWVIYRHGHKVQKIKYKNGVLMWIELENGNRFTKEQIQINTYRQKPIHLLKSV